MLLQGFEALVHCFYRLGIGAQGECLFLQASVEQRGIERRHLLQAIETLPDAVQRGDPRRSHHRSQQQHQGKPQPKLAGHAQVGEKTTLGRTHRTSPCCPQMHQA
ncbi:hypothetical protein D3C79_709940 [compost metagenome]